MSRGLLRALAVAEQALVVTYFGDGETEPLPPGLVRTQVNRALLVVRTRLEDAGWRSHDALGVYVPPQQDGAA